MEHSPPHDQTLDPAFGIAKSGDEFYCAAVVPTTKFILPLSNARISTDLTQYGTDPMPDRHSKKIAAEIVLERTDQHGVAGNRDQLSGRYPQTS